MRQLLIALLLILAACAQPAPQNTDVDLPTIEPAPTVEEPPVPQESAQPVAPVEAGHEKIWGNFTKQGPFHNLTCDPTTRTLTFTIENPTDLTWQLDKQLPFPQPKGMAIVAFTYNSIDVNKRGGTSFNGEMIFWQGDKFSDNCEGDALLEPGEVTTCVLKPVPFKAKESFDAGTNELNVNAPSVYFTVTFRCG